MKRSAHILVRRALLDIGPDKLVRDRWFLCGQRLDSLECLLGVTGKRVLGKQRFDGVLCRHVPL